MEGIKSNTHESHNFYSKLVSEISYTIYMQELIIMPHTHRNSLYYGLAVAWPICRDGPISKWRLQSMYYRFHSNIITGEQMLAYKSTLSSLKGLPQSTVVMAMYSNHFKVANLKRPKNQDRLSSFFFLQPV